MKKLMTVLASAALAFGLYAGDSFEAGEDGVNTETTPATFEPVEGSPWNASALSDPLEIGVYGGVNPYSDAAMPARRDAEFKYGEDNYNFLNLDTGTEKLTRAMGDGNLVIDQIVKFSGFDEVQTNFVDGATKIAVWMSDIEKDGEPNETNLYVTCGKVADGKVEPVAIKIAGDDWELGKWYRLTIKSIGQIYSDTTDDSRAGFVVYINGDKVASDDAKGIIEYSSALTAAAGKLYGQGQLFPAIDNTDTTFTSVSYAGTGAIDDIVADVKGPDFAIDNVDVTVAPIEGAIITVKDAEGNVIELAGGKYSVPNGDFTVEYAADKDYILKPNPTIVDHNTDDPEVDDSADVEPKAVIIEVSYDGAKAVPFADAAEALADVTAKTKAGQTADVEFKADVTFGGNTFAEGTLVEISDDATADPVITNWNVSSGDVSFLAGLENNKVVSFDCGENEFTLTFAGLIKAGASLQAADITAAAGAIVLTPETAKVISQNASLDAAFTVPTGYELNKVTAKDEDEVEWTTYTLVEKQIDYVAEIDGKKYETLAAAFAAVGDGETAEITLLKSCSGAGIFLEENAGKTITLDLATYTFNCTGPAVGSKNTQTQAFHLEKGNTVTIKNGKVTSTAGSNVKMLVQNYVDLTLVNVELDGSNLDLASNAYTLSNVNGTINLDGTTKIVSKGEGSFAFDVDAKGKNPPANNFNYGPVIVKINSADVEVDGTIELGRTNDVRKLTVVADYDTASLDVIDSRDTTAELEWVDDPENEGYKMIQVKKNTDPEPTDPSEGTVVKGDDGAWVITPAEGVTEFVVKNAGDNDFVVEAAADFTIKGVAADKITIKCNGENITQYCLGGTEGFSTALDPEKVTPELIEAGDDEQPLVIGENVDLTIKASIPGLAYKLIRTAEPGDFGTVNKVTTVTTVKGNGEQLTLTDTEKPADKAFYKVAVGKDAIND